MKKIDSQALGILNKAFGLFGRGSPATELTDGIVDQVVDVAPIVRRSRTQARSEGLYTALLRNVHSGAQSRTAVLSPFNASAATVVAPYPSPFPEAFDLWLLSTFVQQLSGTGTFSGALRVTVPPSKMGLQTIGAPATASMQVAFWDTVVTENTTFAVKSGQTEPMQKIGMRVPRTPTTTLTFASTSSATATFDCFCILGVFPVGLGQDVVV